MQSRRRRKELGFSLAEVLIAMFVIVVGIAGVTATIWWGSTKADAGKLIQEASNLGRYMMETVAIRSRPLAVDAPAWPTATSGMNDAADVRRPLDAAPFDAGLLNVNYIQNTILNSQSNISRFRRNITCTRLPGGAANYADSLCTVTIRIYWQDKQSNVNPRVREHHVTSEMILPHGR